MTSLTNVPELILCDLDGTLADSMPYLYQVYLAFLRSHGHQGSEAEFQQLVGPPLAQVLLILKQRYELDVPDDALHQAYYRMLATDYAAHVQLAHGARAFLSAAYAHGARLMVVTSATSHFVDDFLTRENIAVFFEGMVTAEDVVRGKPHPEPYLLALKRAAVLPQHAIAVEDSAGGVASATTAGIVTYWLSPTPTMTKTPMTGLVRRTVSWPMLQEQLYPVHSDVK
jgi:HAD superfamily hydrolase (TIGR01509 family)